MCRWSLIPLLSVLLYVSGCGLPNCRLSPSITGQPSGQTVSVGQSALFTVAASGTAPLTYQWLKNGVAIPGATQASYLDPPASTVDSGSSFTVTVRNELGTLTSLPAYLTVSTSTSGNTRYVAPNGDDANPGTIDQPYRTIQYCASTVSAGWTCQIRAGTYRETVIPNSGVTISAYNFEAVVVDGSDPITGWTLDHDSVYKASVTLKSDDTNQVFVGSEMMTEARWPNGDDLFAVNWATAQKGTDSGHLVDGLLPKINWVGAKIHLWSGTDPFGHETGIVTASDSGRISINVGQTGTCPYICPVAGGYYYLFGTLSALDTEREWYYDVNSSILYFMAPGGVNPNTLDVRGKQRQYAFDLRGKSGVTVRGITVFASTIVTDQSSSNNTLDRINAQYPSHFTGLPNAADDSSGTNFSILQVHRGDSGIILNGTGNTLENSTIAYSAGAGVALEGSNNLVRNNWIHHIDYIGDYASGINLDGDGNSIQYNTIQNAGRQAIYVVASQLEDIGYNDLSNSMLLSRDGGEIYACCLQLAISSRIHHNWIHDTWALVPGAADDAALAGIDIDDGSSGFTVDQNVLWANQHLNITIDGVSINNPLVYDVINNSIPDTSSKGNIQIFYVPNCASVRIVDNRLAVGVAKSSTTCDVSDNGRHSPGATEMSTSTGVGCNFLGCSSSGPPVFSSGGSVSACPASVFAKP